MIRNKECHKEGDQQFNASTNLIFFFFFNFHFVTRFSHSDQCLQAWARSASIFCLMSDGTAEWNGSQSKSWSVQDF